MQVQLVHARRQQTVRHAQTLGRSQQPFDFVFADGRVFTGFGIGADLLFVRDDLILQLAHLLAGARERVSLAIETFVTMATHAAAFREKIAAEVQRVSAVSDAIARVTLLAAGLRYSLSRTWARARNDDVRDLSFRSWWLGHCPSDNLHNQIFPACEFE